MFQVKDEAMSYRVGIVCGDTAICYYQPTVEDGKVAVVCWDGQTEPCLRRIWRRNGQILLTADNPAYEAILLPPEKIIILGRVDKIWSDTTNPKDRHGDESMIDEAAKTQTGPKNAPLA